MAGLPCGSAFDACATAGPDGMALDDDEAMRKAVMEGFVNTP